MAGTIEIFCIRMNILSHRNNIVLFLACNMAAMQNLYMCNRFKSGVFPIVKRYLYSDKFLLVNLTQRFDEVRHVYN